ANLADDEDEDPKRFYPHMVWPTNNFMYPAATMWAIFFAGEDYAPKTKIDNVLQRVMRTLAAYLLSSLLWYDASQPLGYQASPWESMQLANGNSVTVAKYGEAYGYLGHYLGYMRPFWKGVDSRLWRAKILDATHFSWVLALDMEKPRPRGVCGHPRTAENNLDIRRVRIAPGAPPITDMALNDSMCAIENSLVPAVTIWNYAPDNNEKEKGAAGKTSEKYTLQRPEGNDKVPSFCDLGVGSEVRWETEINYVSIPALRFSAANVSQSTCTSVHPLSENRIDVKVQSSHYQEELDGSPLAPDDISRAVAMFVEERVATGCLRCSSSAGYLKKEFDGLMNEQQPRLPARDKKPSRRREEELAQKERIREVRCFGVRRVLTRYHRAFREEKLKRLKRKEEMKLQAADMKRRMQEEARQQKQQERERQKEQERLAREKAREEEKLASTSR
ncbi:hypothetical protein FOZ60_000671, partial [Perkinsus olseni]